jgi:hypothetical protein
MSSRARGLGTTVLVWVSVAAAGAAGATERPVPTLADRGYEDVKQVGLDNLEAGREDAALRYLGEAASRPEAAGDLDLLFLTAHMYRDACRIEEMRALLPRAQNAAELAGRTDLAGDAEALSQEAASAYQPVELTIRPAFADWVDLLDEKPTLTATVTRTPSNPALAACAPRVIARWNAQLGALPAAHERPEEVATAAWRLSAELPLAGYALAWAGCRRDAGDEAPCPTAALELPEARTPVPREVDLALAPTLPSEERPLIRARHLPWLIGGGAALLTAGLLTTCFVAQPISACR